MSLYLSVLKQYTSPTCRLEILSRSPAIDSRSQRSRISPLSFQLQIQSTDLQEEEAVDENESTELSVGIRGNLDELQSLHTAIQNYLQAFLGRPDLARLMASVNPATPSDQIALLPKSLTQHTLQLGSLADESSVSVVELASTQLFDLASTLDHYASESPQLLPDSQPVAGFWVRAGQVAAVAIAATGLAGLLASLIPFSQNALNPQIASRQTLDQQSTKAGSTPGVLPPVPTGSSIPTPFGSTIGTVTQTPMPMGTLAPTPVPTATLAVPGVPVPQASPFSTPIPTVVATMRPSTQLLRPSMTPAPAPPGMPSQPRPVAPPVVVVASRPQTQPPAAKTRRGTPIPASGTFAPLPQMQVPPLPSNADQQSSAVARVPDNQESRSRALETLAPIRPTNQSGMQATGNSSGTVFDTIQQVGEVRQFFQGRWQPPTELNQVLEYHLMLNSDGSLWQIVPLGESSGRYLERTGMPAVGAPFVSPIPENQKAKIRLVLFPDGRVQTFLEGLN